MATKTDKKEANSPIWILAEKVGAAVAEYDRSDDHESHGADADCIRCRLVGAFNGDSVKPFTKVKR